MILYQKGNMVATGRLSKDAEFRVAGQRQSHFCSFSIPAMENANGETTWINVDAAFECADSARNLKKGDHVLVCGKMESREYVGRDGVRKTVQALKADFVLPMIQSRGIDELANAFPGTVNVVNEGKPVWADELDDGALPWEDEKSVQSVSGNGRTAPGFGGVQYDA